MSTTTHTSPAHAPANQSGSAAGTTTGTQPADASATAPPPYIDLPTPIPWADWQAAEASNIAALKPAAQFAVKGPGAPEEFPKTLYNKDKRLTKAATDKKDEEKLQGEGYSETPFAPPAVEVTPEMVQHLETVFAAAAIALQELKQLVVKQQQQQQQASSQSQPAPPAAASAPTKK